MAHSMDKSGNLRGYMGGCKLFQKGVSISPSLRARMLRRGLCQAFTIFVIQNCSIFSIQSTVQVSAQLIVWSNSMWTSHRVSNGSFAPSFS